nr:ABC transporter substrate-binding protein [uncultured Bacteroides sp.]
MKKHIIVISIIFAALIFTSCKGKERIAEKNELQEINLGVMPSMDYIPFAVAQKMGIYDSLGLSVNFVRYLSPNDRDDDLKWGKLDGAITDLTRAISMQANGLGLKIIMKNDGILYLIVGKESGIKNLSDLRQTNIGISENTVTEFSTDMVLQLANILTVNVNKPNITKMPVRLEMLQNGQIDASFFPDPYATAAKSNGHKSLISTKDLGINATETVFTERAIKDKKEEIKVLVIGYNLGVNFIKTHPLKEWSDILKEDTDLPQSIIKKIPLPNYQQAELPKEKDIKASIGWLKIKQLIPESYSEKKIIDSTFVKKPLP